MKSLTNSVLIRRAGNFSDRVSEDTLNFYVDFTVFFMRGLVGDEVYLALLELEDDDETKLRLQMAETFFAVSFVLPAVGVLVIETGAIGAFSAAGAGWRTELISPSRELMSLSLFYYNLAKSLVPASMIRDENLSDVWYGAVQKVFPSVDEQLSADETIFGSQTE